MNDDEFDSFEFAEFFSVRVHGLMRESEVLGYLTHPVLKGSFREILINCLLEPLIPPSCGIYHGTVIDSFPNDRKQDKHYKTEHDILIVDHECLPPFFNYLRDGIFPIESVLARIEVKSKLTKKELRDCLKGAKDFSDLKMRLANPSDEINAAPIQAVFAFSSVTAGFQEKSYKRIREILKQEKHPYPPLIKYFCVPDEGFWGYYRKKDTNKATWYYCEPQDLEWDDRLYTEVISFIGMLLNDLPEIRESRKSASLGYYIPCLRDDLMKKI